MNLFDDFSALSSKAWKQKIQFDLQGEDYNKTLLTPTNEEIFISPFYHFDSFEKLEIPNLNIESISVNKIKIVDEAIANKKAQKSINNGFKSICFEVDFLFNFRLLFESLLKQNITFHLEFSFLDELFLKELQEFLQNEKVLFNLDVIGHLAKTGNSYSNYHSDITILKNKTLNKNPNHCFLSVHSVVYQNAGANIVQQIAYALAHGTEYLLLLGDKKNQNIHFRFSVGSNYFFEISKLRAFRYLWDLILNEYQLNTTNFVSVEKTNRNNLISPQFKDFREDVVSEIAYFGSADFVFENRNNNYQNIQNFTNSSSSFYIESITKQVAERAFEIFKTIEKGGGFLNQLKKGNIQRKIRENAVKEQQKIQLKKEIYKGVYGKQNKVLKQRIAHNPVKTVVYPIIPKQLL